MDVSKPFRNPTLGRLTYAEVLDEIISMMHSSPDDVYELVVGTDSQAYHDVVEYVSAIVVHRVGKGGRYFWQGGRERKPLSLRERIWRETWLSYELAQQVIASLQEREVFDVNLEIHVDVGRSGRTRDMVEEVVGMIIGGGFHVRTKPDAYAATTVADKHT